MPRLFLLIALLGASLSSPALGEVGPARAPVDFILSTPSGVVLNKPVVEVETPSGTFTTPLSDDGRLPWDKPADGVWVGRLDLPPSRVFNIRLTGGVAPHSETVTLYQGTEQGTGPSLVAWHLRRRDDAWYASRSSGAWPGLKDPLPDGLPLLGSLAWASFALFYVALLARNRRWGG